ncbi:MAG: hypothetical protein LAT64_08605 [Phycisphaerales bacterium]|nr:hypothetical protein [Planctomycetota bacterium]MCH8508811.1 hypothetical protein [Phycisphaerales bacterium]
MTIAAVSLAQTLPEGGMVPLFIALAAGLALWLAGVKIVRTVFLALGAAAGGFVGSVLLPLSGMPSLNIGITLTPGFTGLIIGGIFGAIAAMGLLRVVVILTAAGAMAVVGTMAALVFLHFNPSPQSDYHDPAAAEYTQNGAAGGQTTDLARRTREQTSEALDLLNRSVPDGTPAAEFLGDLNTDEARERILDAAERSRAFIAGVAENLQADYERRPDRDKLIILSSTLAGLAVGLLVGVAMPRRSSALITSLFGSALWLAAGVALIRANTDPAPAFVAQPPLVWAVIWGLTAVAGMAVQFGLIRRKGAKPANEAAAD